MASFLGQGTPRLAFDNRLDGFERHAVPLGQLQLRQDRLAADFRDISVGQGSHRIEVSQMPFSEYLFNERYRAYETNEHISLHEETIANRKTPTGLSRRLSIKTTGGERMPERLLPSLSDAHRALLTPRCTPEVTRRGKHVYRAGQHMDSLTLMNRGLVSVQQPTHNGTLVDIFTFGTLHGAIIGGHALFTPSRICCYDYLARTETFGLRITFQALEEVFTEDPTLRQPFEGYKATMAQMQAQNILCRSIHTLPQRLARQLLVMRATFGDRIRLSQTVIAEIVPCNRQYLIHDLLPPLVNSGVIRLGKGYVDILDVDGLRPCECHDVIIARRHEYFDNVNKIISD